MDSDERLAPEQIYVRKLSSCGFGHPLFYPEPYRNGHVTNIGDVGYFRSDGQFVYMFNCIAPTDKDPLPDSLEPFKLNQEVDEALLTAPVPSGLYGSPQVVQVPETGTSSVRPSCSYCYPFYIPLLQDP